MTGVWKYTQLAPGAEGGIELVSNGTFTTDTTGWTAGNLAVLSINSNNLRITNGITGASYAFQSVTVKNGYVYQCTVVNRANGGKYYVGTAEGLSDLLPVQACGAEVNILQFVAVGTTAVFHLLNPTSVATETADYDNASIKTA